jgi:hypothetical protein
MPTLLANIHTLTGWEGATGTVSWMLRMPDHASSYFLFACENRDVRELQGTCCTYVECELLIQYNLAKP